MTATWVPALIALTTMHIFCIFSAYDDGLPPLSTEQTASTSGLLSLTPRQFCTLVGSTITPSCEDVSVVKTTSQW
jgi:hypothetical protein